MRRRELVLPVLVFSVVSACYGVALHNGFVYDDHEVIRAQPAPRNLADVAALFTEPHFHGLPYYRPVTRATLLLQKALHGESAFLFHLANTLLAGAGAWLTVVLLRSSGLRIAAGPALLAAAAFALHPVASSAVHPIASGRETLLPAVLALATVAAHLRGRTLLATAAFALALFAKEQIVVLPAVLALADALGLSARRGGLVERYGGVLAVGLIYAAVRLLLFGGGEFRPAVLEAPAGPLLSLAYGLQVTALPFAGLFYEPPVEVWLSPARLLAAAGLVALLGGGFVRSGLGRLGLFWAGWFVILQLPTANLLHQEAAFAERYVFLASLALPAALATLASHALRPDWRRAAAVAASLVIVVLASLSVFRSGDFADDRAFATRWLETNPRSVEAHQTLGLLALEDGRLETALAHFDQALQHEPEFAEAHHNRGSALVLAGRRFEAAAAFTAALRIAPDHPEAHNNLGLLLAEEGDFERAIDHYRRALDAAPRFAQAHNNLGTALARSGDVRGAEVHLREAIRIEPDYGDARRNLRILLER